MPGPPGCLITAAGKRRRAARGENQEDSDPELPVGQRPWDPHTYAPELQPELWDWYDRAAAWINEQYTWRTDQVIPACWPQHPHIAHELTVVIYLRWHADVEGAETLEAWQRQAYPTFCDRMAARLGDGCRRGKHDRWPGQSRHVDYLNDPQKGLRKAALGTDRQPDRR